MKDNRAVAHADWFTTVRGRRIPRKTTAGWKLCVLWHDGSMSWERLAALKESNPVKVVEYSVARKIDNKLAFAWWVPWTLKKRDRIIAAVNKQYHKCTLKFGIEIPKTVKRALELDRENNNTLWMDAIAKEMAAACIALAIQEEGKAINTTHQYMECHMIFKDKLDGFR